MISLVVAAAENDVIGIDGGLPWHLPEDLKRFKQLTIGHVVIAGRRTHESIVARLGHALPGRTTVVVTSQPRLDSDGVRFSTTVDEALTIARDLEPTEVFVIGGAEIYAAMLSRVDRIYLTRVHRIVEGDAVMPPAWLDGFALRSREPHPEFTYELYERD
jgi:dihydrofolate reductase